VNGLNLPVNGNSNKYNTQWYCQCCRLLSWLQTSFLFRENKSKKHNEEHSITISIRSISKTVFRLPKLPSKIAHSQYNWPGRVSSSVDVFIYLSTKGKSNTIPHPLCSRYLNQLWLLLRNENVYLGRRFHFEATAQNSQF
jgi:hypothetical protein